MIERSTKVCKQCGKELHLSRFRKYTSRKSVDSTRITKTAENTICIECESFNNSMTRLFKIPEESRTQQQNEMLERAASLYRSMAARGLHPLGAYARHILGISVGAGRGNRTALARVDNYFSTMEASLGGDETMDENIKVLEGWLNKELTEVPDYYLNEVYDSLTVMCRDKSISEEAAESMVSRGIKFEYEPIYRQLLESVHERFWIYEENYDWDKER